MTNETLQLTPQKYKGSEEPTINNYIKIRKLKKQIFLYTHNLTKTVSRLESNQIEAAIKSLPLKKIQWLYSLTCAKHLKNYSVLLKLFQKQKDLPAHQNQMDMRTKKNYPNILDEHGCNILNKILANEIQQHIKKNTMITWAPSQGCDDD